MFSVECDGKAILAVNMVLLQLYTGLKVNPESQAEYPERVTKRIKLDDGTHQSTSPQISSNQDVDPGRVILWDFQINIDVAAHPCSIDCATFDGFETTDFQLKSLDKTIHRRHPHMQITFDSLGSQHAPLLILDMCRGSSRDKMLLLHAIAIANGKNIVEKRLKEVYADVSCTQSLTISGTKVIIVLKSIVNQLEVASTSSRKLAKNVMYRTLIDEQYMELDVTPANVSTFNNAIHPPPVSTDVKTPAGIKTELMQYQKNAVGWMLHRELGSSEQPNFWIPFLDDRGLVTYLQKEIGLITREENVVWQRKNPILGGLLCDEMGLGKTLEVIALVSSNTRKAPTTAQKMDYFTGNSVRPVATTLIVSPQSILEQWLHEVAKHSDLKAYHYRGINFMPMETDLGYYDIVITSYSVLASEVHYAAPVNTDRKLRSEPQYVRRRSPLTQTEWWRVIMDEAQMIQTGLSSAAQVACLLPRVFGWIVTGTPISKSCADLFGLLHFLRVEPIYAHQSLWNKLIASNSGALLISALFEPLSCRNTKALVAQEMQLPPQRRYLCETSLTALEEQNFRDLLIRAFDDIGLDLQGVPAKDRSWKDIDASKISSWVTQLRQACSHPQIGSRNKGIHNIMTRPILALDEVLDTMNKSAENDLDVAYRAFCSETIQKGRVLEYRTDQTKALRVWLDILPIVLTKVEASRSKYSNFTVEVSTENKIEEAQKSKLSLDLRYWREILHRCFFFLGSIYFQLEDGELEKEYFYILYYAKAKDVRSQLLSETECLALTDISSLKGLAQAQSFSTIPELRFSDYTGGIQTREIMERLQGLTELLNAQANQLDEYRESCIAKLTTDLADQQDDPSGEEYQQSLDAQADAFWYHELIRFMVADRVCLVLGTRNMLIEDAARKAAQSVREDEAAVIIRDGLKARAALMPSVHLGSLNSIRLDLRQRIRTLDEGLTSSRSKATQMVEIEIANRVLQQLDRDLEKQKQCLAPLNKEVEMLSSTYNSRLEYYKQFQTISDDVQEFTVLRRAKAKTTWEKLDDQLSRATGNVKIHEVDESDISDIERSRRLELSLKHLEDELARLQTVIDQRTTRVRYLQYLKSQKTSGESELCTICTSEIEIGAFTQCGHIFCRDCFRMWFREHRACPICKTLLKNKDAFQSITLAKQIQTTTHDSTEHGPHGGSSFILDHYEPLDKNTRQLIEQVKLIRSYSCKIDAIVKHLLSLPHGSKSVLYSNWTDVLIAFQVALTENNIQTAQLGNLKSQVCGKIWTLSDFMNDPDCAVLLMSGKSQSAGLTLVNATNLFLVEPLLNPAIEAQVVSRIHRIGQRQVTNVFQYVVSGTLEMEILHRSCAQKAKEKLNHSGPDTAQPETAASVPLISTDQPNSEQAITLLQSNHTILANKEAVFDAQDTLLGVI